MGKEPASVPPLEQKCVTVMPTRTICQFEGAGVALTLTFLTAALPDDIANLSGPVTYLTYDVRATDGKSHAVAFHFDTSPELTVNEPRQPVVSAWENMDRLEVLKVGSQGQAVLARKGDDLRIDWGYCAV